MKDYDSKSSCKKSGEIKDFSGRLAGTGSTATANHGDGLVKATDADLTSKVRQHDGHPMQKGHTNRA